MLIFEDVKIVGIFWFLFVVLVVLFNFVVFLDVVNGFIVFKFEFLFCFIIKYL